MLHRIELQHRPDQIFSATLQRCFAWAGRWVARVWKEKRVFKCVYPALLMSGSGAKQCPHTFRQQSESAVATLLHWRGGCSGLRDNNISLNWYSRYSSTGDVLRKYKFESVAKPWLTLIFLYFQRQGTQPPKHAFKAKFWKQVISRGISVIDTRPDFNIILQFPVHGVYQGRHP